MAAVMLYPYFEPDMKNVIGGNGADGSRDADSFASYVSQLGGFVYTNSEVLGTQSMNGNNYIERLMAFTSSDDDSINSVEDSQCTKRCTYPFGFTSLVGLCLVMLLLLTLEV